MEDGDNYREALESAGELVDDEDFGEDGIEQELKGGDEGEWLQEEDEDVEDDKADEDMDGEEDETEEDDFEQNEDEGEYELERDEDQRLP